ncbi:MAG: peptide chain release factor N(5)-glutamine methyltransferase [Candidatus Omnitrophota bacterium]
MRSQRELLEWAQTKIDRLDSELLLSHVLGASRADLYTDNRRHLDEKPAARFRRLVEERASGRPLQYITGEAEFMGLEFKVSKDVLIPRPETELLVEAAVESIRAIREKKPGKPVTVLDLGTGSGNIAISLTKFLPDCTIVSSDVSPLALEAARINARFHGVEDRVQFVESDLFTGFRSKKFDVIVSNPPYIAGTEFDSLSRELYFEPRLALYGGRDGAYFYRKIISQAPRYLRGEGSLLLELGYNTVQCIDSLLTGLRSFRLIKDYSGFDRVLVAQ